MNPWEGMASQMFGMGMGAQAQGLSGAFGSGMSPYSSGNYIPIAVTTTTSNTFYDNTITDVAEERIEEPPDEFTQLSNHKFHELLDKFSKLT